MIPFDDSITSLEVFQAPSLPTLGTSDLRDISLRQQNVQALEAIQKIILIEEERAMSHDEILTRILDFYNMFVPFKGYMRKG